MAFLAAVIVTALLFKDHHLVTARLFQHLGGNGSTVDQRCPHGGVVTIAHHQHITECDRITGVPRELFHLDDVAGSHFVLLAACFDDCEH